MGIIRFFSLHYYINIQAIRKAGGKARTRIVRISDNPKTIRAHELNVNGKIVRNARFSIWADFGKACVLMEQEIDGETIRTLAIPTVNEEGKMTQLLITEPTLFNLVPLENEQ